jgi:hypothetical protein
MRTRTLLLASLVLMTVPACSVPTVAVQAGFAQLSLDGDIGYVQNTETVSIGQDAKAFGLGDKQGSPYVRGQVDFGMPVLTVSGFSFEDEGQGRLGATGFGRLKPLGAVNSTLEMQALKLSYAFDIGFGPVAISPGFAVDYFDLSIEATNGLITERVDLNSPFPLLFLRATVDFGTVGAFVEAGYLGADIDDVDGTLLDIEAQLLVRPWSALELFVGYRYLQLQLDVSIDDDSFDTDLTISGLIFGGGLKF